MPEIKAIETRYKEYRFRSRLEARWAVFFDALNMKWEYEPEGFEFDGIKYLPDFYLPEDDMYVEIKPTFPEDDLTRQKLVFFVCNIHKPLMLLVGTPGKHQPIAIIAKYGWCDECEQNEWLWSGAKIDLKRELDDIINAVSIARSARFEHGESG